MADQEFAYPNAPITEALIDFRVIAREAVTVERLSPITEALSSRYPNVEQRQTAFATFVSGQQQPSGIQLTPLGYIGRTVKNDWVYQARLDGVSVSRLHPYTCWSDLRDEARRVWDVYSNTLEVASIARIGLRYINRIDIAESRIELNDFFNTRIEYPPGIPGDISQFYAQIQIPQRDLACNCVINTTSVVPNAGAQVSILFDIDLFTDPGTTFTSAGAWELLERMRVRKNEIFEASITDRTKGLFA